MQEKESIPGLAEAIDQEQTRRQLAFADTLIQIGGVWVKQFTPGHWINLGLIRSPFLGGDRGTPFSTVGVLEFLWICSPDYRPAAFWRQLWFFFRHYSKINPATAMEIYDYLAAAFQDSPPQPVGVQVDRRSYYASVASLCDFFAAEYGWSDTLTMQTPIARLFQYFSCIRKRKDPKAILFNPSDRVRAKALHQRNANGG